MRLRILTAASALLLLLAACGGDPDPVWRQAVGLTCAKHAAARVGPLCKTHAPEPETVSRFCYDTLGDPNCFDQPDEISKNQELGSTGK